MSSGEVFVHPPGEPHQLTNTGTIDLEVLIIADNPALDGCHYPDSDKWSLRPPGKFFRLQETDYFDGEELLPAGTNPAPHRPAGAPPAPALTSFTQRKLHPDSLPWVPWTSPKEKFRGTSKELSIALGALRKTPVGLGGHPFDLELSRLTAGESGCPFHSHASQWELFFFLSGKGHVRTSDGSFPVGPGDVVLQAPGDPHQVRASADEDLTFFLIADNPPVDFWYYPDSKKWGLTRPNIYFYPREADYWEGEE